MEDKKVLGKSIMWNTVGSVYYAFCQWVMTVIIIYMSRDYAPVGVLGLSMTVTNSFASIASFGMRSFQVSDIRKVYTDDNYITSRIITCLGAYAACIVYSLCIHATLNEIVCITIYMAIRAIDSMEDVFQGVLQVNWRFDVIGKSYLARGTLQLIAFVGVFMLTHKLYVTFIAMAVCDAAVFIFFDVIKTKKIAGISALHFDKKIIKLLQACSKLVVYQFMITSLATVVRVSVRKLCGVDVLGVYSTIAAPTVIIQLTASVIYSPFLPDISHSYFDGDRKKFLRYIKVIAVIIVAAFIILNFAGYFLGEFALTILYNKDIASHSELLLPLIWCTFFAACVWFFAGMLIAIRKTNQLIIGAVAAFVLNFVINKPLILRFGENGASYSQVISEVLLMIAFIVMILIDVHRYRKDELPAEPSD